MLNGIFLLHAGTWLQFNDLGSVHERAAAIFAVYVSQYSPAALPGEEDRVVVSGGGGRERCEYVWGVGWGEKHAKYLFNIRSPPPRPPAPAS